MEKLASITTHPSLHQQLQDGYRHGGWQGSLYVMEWIMAALHTVWANTGDVPDSVSRWQSLTDLVQILWDVGMCQAMFNPYTQVTDDECFTAGMQELVLQHAPPSSRVANGDFSPVCPQSHK